MGDPAQGHMLMLADSIEKIPIIAQEPIRIK